MSIKTVPSSVPFSLSARPRVFDLATAARVFAHAISPLANVAVHATLYPEWALKKGMMPDGLRIPCDCLDAGRQRGVVVVLFDRRHSEALVWGYVDARYIAREAARFSDLRSVRQSTDGKDAGSVLFECKQELKRATLVHKAAAAAYDDASVADQAELVRLARARNDAAAVLKDAELKHFQAQEAAAKEAAAASSAGEADEFTVAVRHEFSAIPPWLTALSSLETPFVTRWQQFDWYATRPLKEIDVPYLERCVRDRLDIYRFIRKRRALVEKAPHNKHLHLAAAALAPDADLSKDALAMLFLRSQSAIECDRVAFHFMREATIFTRMEQAESYVQLLEDMKKFERTIAEIRLDVVFDRLLGDAVTGCHLVVDAGVSVISLGPVFPARQSTPKRGEAKGTDSSAATCPSFGQAWKDYLYGSEQAYFAAYSQLCRCDFEFATSLVFSGEVVFWQGDALFPVRGLRTVVLSRFRDYLERAFAQVRHVTALQMLAAPPLETRRKPHVPVARLVNSTIGWAMQTSGAALSDAEKQNVSVTDIEALVRGENVPPCMRKVQTTNGAKFAPRQLYFNYFLQLGGSLKALEDSLRPGFLARYTKLSGDREKAKTMYKGIQVEMKWLRDKGRKFLPAPCSQVAAAPETAKINAHLCPYVNKPQAAPVLCAKAHGIPSSQQHSGPVGFTRVKWAMAKEARDEKKAQQEVRIHNNKRAAERKLAATKARLTQQQQQQQQEQPAPEISTAPSAVRVLALAPSVPAASDTSPDAVEAARQAVVMQRFHERQRAVAAAAATPAASSFWNVVNSAMTMLMDTAPDEEEEEGIPMGLDDAEVELRLNAHAARVTNAMDCSD